MSSPLLANVRFHLLGKYLFCRIAPCLLVLILNRDEDSSRESFLLMKRVEHLMVQEARRKSRQSYFPFQDTNFPLDDLSRPKSLLVEYSSTFHYSQELFLVRAYLIDQATKLPFSNHIGFFFLHKLLLAHCLVLSLVDLFLSPIL